MNELARKKCKPCEGGIDPLTPEQVRPMLKGLQGWAQQPDGMIANRWLTTIAIDPTLAGFDLGEGDVETNGPHLCSECHHQGQADVAQADDCDRRHFLVSQESS